MAEKAPEQAAAQSEEEAVNDPLVGDEEGTAEENAELDAVTDDLLKQLQDSQAEVHRLLQQQRDESAELGLLKQSMATELEELQGESWRLQVFAELEMLKRQLAAIHSLDQDLEGMEAQLSTLDEEEAALNGDDSPGPKVTAVVEAEAEAEDDLGDVSALQEELDAELAAMYKQLEAVKAEAAMVNQRKAALEAELLALLAADVDDDGGDGGGGGEGDEAAAMADLASLRMDDEAEEAGTQLQAAS